jgi:putative aldouronate transport system permease protein
MLIQRKFSGILISILVAIISLICILPMIHEVSLSFSSNEAVLSQKVVLLPVEPTIGPYKEVFKDGTVLRALYFSIVLTITFTIIAMVLTIACAYPLTRPELKGREFIMTVIIITMYFSGGILPLYILVKSLGLLNTMWALIFPLCLSPFNLIILRTSLSSIPESLTESAFLDGASYFQILRRVILPLSLPILATLSLFYAVGRWNTFQDALFYITKVIMYTLQLKLAYIVLNNTSPEIFLTEGAASSQTIVPAAITAATVFVATVPILIVYPWLQKYFITGTMIGSVKE